MDLSGEDYWARPSFRQRRAVSLVREDPAAAALLPTSAPDSPRADQLAPAAPRQPAFKELARDLPLSHGSKAG